MLTELLNVQTAVRYEPAEEPPAASRRWLPGAPAGRGSSSTDRYMLGCSWALSMFPSFIIMETHRPLQGAKRAPWSYYIL